MPTKRTRKTTCGKVRYEVDPYNRLVITETGRKTELPRFRKVLDGRFVIDKNNSLSYLIRTPVPGELGIPHQIKLQGRWAITETHNLRLTLNKWGRQTLGDKLTLQGRIIDVDKNSLLFAVTTRTKRNTQSTYVLKIQGRWQADKHNRLAFWIKREKGRYDILTFNGSWNINEHHNVIYQYQKARLVRKQKELHTLAFEGYWDIKDKGRIYYVLDRRSDAGFSFKTGLGIFKENYIKYKVLIDISGEAEPVTRTVTLYGQWKIEKGVGLIFEVVYENRKIQAITFGAEVRLTSKSKVSFKLRNEQDKNIGAELELSRRILKGDGLSFFRFLKTERETGVFIGAGFRW